MHDQGLANLGYRHHSPTFGGRPDQVVRHHPARPSSSRRASRRGRGAPARRLRRQPHPLRGAVTRSMPGDSGRSPTPWRTIFDERRGPRVPGSRPPVRPEGAADAVPHNRTSPRSTLLARLAPADGDEHPVLGRVGDIGPAQGARLPRLAYVISASDLPAAGAPRGVVDIRRTADQPDSWELTAGSELAGADYRVACPRSERGRPFRPADRPASVLRIAYQRPRCPRGAVTIMPGVIHAVGRRRRRRGELGHRSGSGRGGKRVPGRGILA